MGSRSSKYHGHEKAKEDMIPVPNTYAEWVSILELFGNKLKDEETIPAMHAGKLDWQPGVADRFSLKLVDAVNKRMNDAIDRFTRTQQRSAGSEMAIANALMTLRKEFVIIINALDIAAIPEDYRAKYMLLVKEQADKVQASLIDSATRSDRSGKTTFLIRKHAVNKF